MASRCIKALNDLDSISDKVFYKYSKNRFRSEIEGRIKASKSKVERSSLDQNCPPNAHKRRDSGSSVNSQERTESNIAPRSRGTKSAACNPKISHQLVKEQKGRAKTTTYCRNRAQKTAAKNKEQTQDENKDKSKLNTRKTPSIYGKHDREDKARTHTESWFNFDNGVKMGTIDSFVCDERNTKALCYGLDKKEVKPVPKLLRHRLEVRIGQNGEVRNDDSGTKETDSKDTANGNMSKKMPLSWEEQLNWENACIKTPRPPTQQKTEDQGLCETHPVIFHPEERPTTDSSSSYDICDSTSAYRLFLERRLLVSDRGNLMCGGKCITSVEIEDARDEAEEKKNLKMINSSLKAYVLDDDRMDMSTTIRNIENIYPRRSAVSNSGSMLNSERVENTSSIESNLVDNPGEGSDGDIPQSKDSERSDKINKKVSFKDQSDLTKKYDSVKVQDTDIEMARDANVRISPSKERPMSSKERTEVFEDVKERPKRPYTAPPCSPRLERDENFEKEIARHFSLAPVRVPTSEEILSDQDGSNATPSLPDNKEETTDNQPAMRVLVACKSAPTHREDPKPEEPISRSLTSMSVRTNKNKYVPPRPVAVLSDSSMELPPNLPPAQALVELRKKIREDLAKETADLQLDIQQLYLKHHATS